MFWVVAKAGNFHGPMAASMVWHALQLLPNMGPRDLAGVSWACAFCVYRDSVLLVAISNACEDRNFAEFSSRHLANLAWAFARAQEKWQGQARVSAKFWVAIVTNIKELKPHEFSITLWAIAKLRLPLNVPEEDFGIVELFGLRTIQQNRLRPQELSNLAYAVARLFASTAASGHGFLSAVVAEATPRIDELEPQHVANMLWSLGHSRFLHDGFQHASKMAIELRISEFAPLEVVALMWSFAKLSIDTAPRSQL